MAGREIAQVGRINPSSITYAAIPDSAGGGVAATASYVDIPTGQVGTTSAIVTVVLTVRHRRIYDVLGLVDQSGGTVITTAVNQQLVLASLDTLAIDPHVADDPRPAPAAGVDGFTAYSSAAQGYALSYPPAWAPVSNPAADLTVRAPDKSALLAAVVVPTNGKDYSDADLRALEDRQIQQAGHVDASGIAHGSVQINGGAYQTATADISPSGGDTLSSLAASTITIIATVHGGRVYAFPGLVNRSPGVGQNNPRYDVEQQLLRASFATVTLV